MKKLFILLFSLCLSGTLPLAAQSGQYKVTEASEKKMPGWVTGITPGHLNVTGLGESVDAARDAALEKLKQQIAESVASRILAQTDFTSVNYEAGDRHSYEQRLRNEVRTKTANLPFISEISLSRAVSYYWEEHYYRETRQVEYFYALLYPYSDAELEALVSEYRDQEKRLNDRLQQFTDNLDRMNSIEEIDRTVAALKAFQQEFLPEDPRFGQVSFLIQEYNRLYNSITVSAVQAKKGVILAVLMLKDREISTNQRPVLRSNCAAKMTTAVEGNTIVIRYDDFPCYEEDENYIEIRFRGGSKTIMETVYIKQSLQVSLTGVITDATTGEPLPYAKVTLLPSGRQTVSGRNGVYQFNDLGAGNYEIQVMKTNFATASGKTYVNAGETARCDLALTRTGDYRLSGTRPAAPVPARPAPAPAPETPGAPYKDASDVVRNGLYAYFTFNGNASDVLGSGISGQLIGGARYTADSRDGSQALQLNAAAESSLSIPKGLIAPPAKDFTVSFWAKGITNGHIFTSSTGSGREDMNVPRLIMHQERLTMYNRWRNEALPFTHGRMDYEWHHIVITSKGNPGSNSFVQTLYIDGQTIDAVTCHAALGPDPVKFIVGGADPNGAAAISFIVDNLRVYNTRALEPHEVQEIFRAEQN